MFLSSICLDFTAFIIKWTLTHSKAVQERWKWCCELHSSLGSLYHRCFEQERTHKARVPMIFTHCTSCLQFLFLKLLQWQEIQPIIMQLSVWINTLHTAQATTGEDLNQGRPSYPLITAPLPSLFSLSGRALYSQSWCGSGVWGRNYQECGFRRYWQWDPGQSFPYPCTIL